MLTSRYSTGVSSLSSAKVLIVVTTERLTAIVIDNTAESILFMGFIIFLLGFCVFVVEEYNMHSTTKHDRLSLVVII